MYYSTNGKNRKDEIRANGHTVRMTILFFLLTVLVYERCFRRYDAGVPSDFGRPCRRLQFESDGRTLQGYLLGQGDCLVVVAAGLGNSACHYAPQIRYFLDAGKRVFAFDYTGTYESAGRSCRGFPQAVDDLRAALRFVRENDLFGSKHLCLFGHSMGGYAVCSVLNTAAADAAVSVGGVNSAMEATISGVYRYFGRLAFLHYPFLYLYQTLRFGRTAVKRQAIDGAKNARALLLVNGVNDWIAPLDRASVVSHVGELQSSGVQCLLWAEPEHDGHADLLFSENDACANPRLMRRIDAFFDRAVGEKENILSKSEKTVDNRD